jgi:formate/nitrite transporter
MLLPMAAFARRITPSKIAINWTLVLIANLVGSLFVAYFLAYKSGVIGTAHSTGSALDAFTRLSKIATGKAVTETHLEVFLRAIGCNWLVALGVWLALAAKDVAGKILGIVFPIMAFVAMGFDHVVANMFFLPLALMTHVPHVTFGDVVWNLVMAFLGNLVGALVFVAGAYWGMYGRTVTAEAAAD